MPALRILLMADTHLGFDLPFRPRIQRRRRGPEFFANFSRALDEALSLEVDAIVHGGDLFYRSRIQPRLAQMVFNPLKKVAAQGIPVFIVPGNHERSMIPHSQFSFHPNICVFTSPRTFRLEMRGYRLAVSGFPFVRHAVRRRFKSLVQDTDWRAHDAHFRLLCMHQSVEGAAVDPAGYVFRRGADVIRAADIPGDFAAVLCGHIHRFQVLKSDLHGRPMASPIFYPGAIDRVSFAERNEPKGYVLIELPIATSGQPLKPKWKFCPLPTRPMVRVGLRPGRMNRHALAARLKHKLAQLPPEAVVKVNLLGAVTDDQAKVLGAAFLRALAPTTMNVSVDWKSRRT